MSAGLVLELDRIVERVTSLAHLVDTLRDENQKLRLAIDRRDAENRLLRDRLDSARGRVETLIARLPADAPADP